MRRALLLASLIALAGCTGVGPVDEPSTGATSETTTARTTTTTGTTAIPTTKRARTTTTESNPNLDADDCGFHREFPRESAETASLPESFDRLPSPPDNLSDDAVVRAAVHHHAVVLDRRLRNRSDIEDYGIGPGTTSTAAAVTRRTELGVCVVVRVPYWVEPTPSSVADLSSLATFFVNRTVVTRA